MIAGIFIRNFKTYQGINYIPITDSPNLNGFLGNNGIGKSSILEAIDAIFNDSTWNYNIVVKKSGLESTKPHIVPFFIIDEASIDKKILPFAKTLDHIVRNLTDEGYGNPQTKQILSDFILHRNRILERYPDINKMLLLPIGQDYNNDISVSILINSKIFSQTMKENKFKINFSQFQDEEDEEDEINEVSVSDPNLFRPLYIYICNKFEYIYIPKEIDTDSFTRLESLGTQVLMGKSLHEILNPIVGDSAVVQINKQLNSFLDDISNKLNGYSYRTSTDRQKNIQKKKFTIL
ncbi:AAA family ATPase [Budvicia aquatica]|uniref:AAA family ATPase n=1 Tax=Budvicia aquatica TaxID=82979 RepID=UPI00207E4863|nr:AAA family ATPase [Budvicia aquatica]GKX51550.1 hypothetical protein SOASR029_18590 [Budvicia aquatica]